MSEIKALTNEKHHKEQSDGNNKSSVHKHGRVEGLGECIAGVKCLHDAERADDALATRDLWLGAELFG